MSTDRLARLALRAAGTESPDPDSAGVTRATGLRLALAGAASVAVGLGRPRTARADQGPCFQHCLETGERALKQALAACDEVFLPRTFVETAPDSWARVRALLRLGASSLFLDLAGASLAGLCYGKAQSDNRRDRDACYRRCETFGRPPSQAPASAKPVVPSAPNPDDDLCAICAKVGGYCCGYKPGTTPTGTSSMCDCACRLPDGGHCNCKPGCA